MKNKKLLFGIIFTLLSLSSRAATVNYSMLSMGLANAAVTGTTVRSTSDANITFSFAQNSSSTAPAFYTTGNAVRLYQHATKGGSIKIYVASGYKITGVTITKASGDGDGPAGYLVDGGAESGTFGDGTTSNVISSINATSYVELYSKGTSATTRCYISAISVTYVSTTPTPTVAADPTFSLAAGAYLSAQQVTISSTDNASIYYTTNGSTPNNTNTLYTAPITVNSNTIIKAICYKTGLTNSGVASATYTFPVNVSTIAALRAQTPDATTIYRVTGEAVLTFKTSGVSSRNQKYIQDATGAVVIDDNGAKIITNYNIGDGIDSIAGTLTLFNSLLEFIPVADPGAATSTGNTVTPEVITIAQLNTGNYDAHLVKINNVTITGSGNFAQSSEYVINDGSTNGSLRAQYANPDYISTVVPLTVRNITGVVYNNTTGPVAKLVPRSLADFETPLCIAPVINTETVNRITCEGNSAKFNIVATGTGITYQWQVNTGSGFSDIIVGSPYSGITNDTLDINPADIILDGNLYRCIITGTCGADTSAEVSLTVNASFSANNPQTICNGNSYTLNSHVYTVTGTYRDTFSTIDGCDSIIITQLTVNPSYAINNSQIVCTGSSYTINGHSYTTDGIYNDTLQSISGCDSIIVTQLTVISGYSTNNAQVICDGGSYVLNGHTYSIAGTYRDTLQAVSGCDSIIVTQLTVNPSYSINNPQSLCDGGSYAINTNTYNVAGTYRDTLHTANGCDSVIVTQLIVNLSYSINNPQVICNGGSYTMNANTYNVAGTYRDTLHTANGCDSIIVTQLTVNPIYSSNNPQTICDGASYVLNSHTYTIAGTYNDTLYTINGCDSIIVTQLTINPSYSVNNPQVICNGGIYTLNANTYNISGTYRDTLHSVNGCDSIIVTQLTVNSSYDVNNPQVICNGGSYTINANTYSVTGTYQDTLHTVNGCDSIVVTQLTINSAYITNNPQSICTGGSYTFNTHTYTTTGTYRDTLLAVIGCDSIIVTQLTVNSMYSNSNPQVICNGSSYALNGHTYTTSGTYRDTLHSVNGCDSIIVTQLTVNPTYSNNNPKVICNGSSYALNGHIYTTAGIYRDTLHSANGCDSIIITQLTVNPTYSNNNPKVICNGSSYVLNGHTYTTSGTYRDTLHSVNGCDSIIVTQLTVNPTYSNNNPKVICNGSSYSLNGHTYTTSGTYRDTLHSINGCDSIIVTQLTVNPTYSNNNLQVICNGSSYVLNGHTYTTSGTYRDTLHSINGCDSIIVTQLTVNPTYSSNNPRAICNGSSYALNGHTYTTSGTYRDTLHSVNGCDSIIVTQLTVNPTYSNNNPKVICNGSSYVLNGHTYTTSGTYRDTLHSVNGCDSIIVTQLTVNAQGVWTGTTNGDWNNTNNWSCPAIPTSSTDVTIPSGVPNMPVITTVAIARNIEINTGGSLTLGSSSQVSIFGSITNSGTFNTTNGKVVFSGSSQQTLPSGIFNKLELNNAAGIVLNGGTILSDSLILTNGKLVLGANDLTIGSNAIIHGGSTASYIVTNGIGSLIVQNIGALGKTGNVIIPVGNATYNPVTLNNSGTADHFTVKVIDSVTLNYTGTTPTGTRLTNNTVNRTWLISEQTAGGSNVNISLQWNGADELSGFSRNSSYVAHYANNAWSAGTAGSATGTNPYVLTLNGVNSFSPFAVGSNGTLPVKLIEFTAHAKGKFAILEWSTAQEIDNNYFEIERSVNGTDFYPIGKVKGKGNSNVLSNYSFTDLSLNANRVNYYRLKQVDLNGHFEYSKTISLQVNDKLNNKLNVYPNPLNSQSKLEYILDKDSKVDIAIYNMLGQQILVLTDAEQTAGMHQIEIPMMSTGVYLLEMIIDNNRQTIKVVVE
jgi:sortase (surface protein transpeptidase)